MYNKSGLASLIDIFIYFKNIFFCFDIVGLYICNISKRYSVISGQGFPWN